MKHYTIKVIGKVQGVFFRASTQDKAESLGLRGKVRNEEDGSVAIEAEGPEDKLHSFVSWCRQGPPRAKVEKVEYAEGNIEHYDAFEVER